MSATLFFTKSSTSWVMALTSDSSHFQVDIGVLMIRIGFWWFLIIVMVEYTPKPYSNN